MKWFDKDNMKNSNWYLMMVLGMIVGMLAGLFLVSWLYTVTSGWVVLPYIITVAVVYVIAFGVLAFGVLSACIEKMGEAMEEEKKEESD